MGKRITSGPLVGAERFGSSFSSHGHLRRVLNRVVARHLNETLWLRQSSPVLLVCSFRSTAQSSNNLGEASEVGGLPLPGLSRRFEDTPLCGRA